MSLKNSCPDDKAVMVSELNNPSSAEMAGFFEDILDRGLSLRIKVTGRSMVPFLKGGEVLTIKKTALPLLRKGDLLFFRDAYGHPVLHRVISRKLTADGQFVFQVKGDALSVCDESVLGAEVLGKVCAIENMNTVIGTGHIDMESRLWKNFNYLLAVINLAEVNIYHIFIKSAMRLRSVFRKMKTLFINLSAG